MIAKTVIFFNNKVKIPNKAVEIIISRDETDLGTVFTKLSFKDKNGHYLEYGNPGQF